MKTYTIKQVAEVLQVTYTTIYRYVKAGKLKACKIGKIYRVTDEQLKEFVDSLSTGKDKSEA